MQPDTLAAVLTPTGVGAIAVIAVRGPGAWTVARELFRPRSRQTQLPEVPSPGQFWLGRFAEPDEDIGDEVVVLVRRLQPTPWLELHCHGGREVIQLITEVLARREIPLVSWQLLEQRSEGKPLQAQALAALAEAPTPRTASILLDQFHGALAEALYQIDEAVRLGQLEVAGALLDNLALHTDVGRHLTQPWRILLAGPPNVGKSSLMNAIAGFERSVVSPTAGTTRDVVSVRTAIDGWPVELLDAAGWRDEATGLEREGIELAKTVAPTVDLCLWLLDATHPAVLPPSLPIPVQLIVNKIDLASSALLADMPDAWRVSATTGEGMANLLARLSVQLVPSPPPPGAAVPFTKKLCELIQKARTLCRAGRLEGLGNWLKAGGDDRD